MREVVGVALFQIVLVRGRRERAGSMVSGGLGFNPGFVWDSVRWLGA